MGKTTIRQDSQINASLTYNQTLAAGAALQTSAVSIEDDLNALRSQISKVLDATGAANFYDAVYTTADGKQRSIKQLNVSLDTLETQTALTWVQVQTNITVPAGQNYVILTAGSSQDPSLPIAISPTTLGAVVAQSSLNGSGFGANELTVEAGANALSPKNLVQIHLASNGQTIESGGLDIWGLLQVESTATNGGTFNDTSGGNRAKISFVTKNTSTGALVAASASAIGGQVIQYSYAQRTVLSGFPEQGFLGSTGYVDAIASVDVTLSNAVQYQNGTPVPVTSNVNWQLGASQNMSFQNAAGTQTFLNIPGSGAVTMNVPSLAITSASTITSTAGETFATATQGINVGVTAGQIDSAGLKLTSTGANALALASGGAITFADGYLSGSTYTASSVKLAASTAEVNTFATNFGATTSLMQAINLAASKANHAQAWANVTAASIAAGTNVTGAGGSANLDAQLPAYGTDFAGQVMVFYNGQLLRSGANSSASCDVYPGTTPATGDIIFSNITLKSSANHTDVIAMIVSEGAVST